MLCSGKPQHSVPSDSIELQDRVLISKYLVYRNFDDELKTNRRFAKYETGSDRFGEQVSRIKFQGFDSLEAAQAFCEKNPLDVELALHGDEEPPEAPSI